MMIPSTAAAVSQARARAPRLDSSAAKRRRRFNQIRVRAGISDRGTARTWAPFSSVTTTFHVWVDPRNPCFDKISCKANRLFPRLTHAKEYDSFVILCDILGVTSDHIKKVAGHLCIPWRYLFAREKDERSPK